MAIAMFTYLYFIESFINKNKPMKKLITLLTIILIAFRAQAQTVKVEPSATGLNIAVAGDYGTCEVYNKMSATKLLCNGGLPVFDNNCISYVTDFGLDTAYCKAAKITGANAFIPFNDPTFNGFGINLFADGQKHEMMFIFKDKLGNWQNTSSLAFIAPLSSFIFPQCPNKPPAPFIWYYEASQQMYFLISNQKDNCPVTMVIKKDGVVVTSANVTDVCGAGASLLIYPDHAVLFGVTKGGTYTSTVTNSVGTATATQIVATVGTKLPAKKK